MKDKKDAATDFGAMAEGRSRPLIVELWDFLRENKKWWLGPIVIVLLLLGALVVLAGSAAAPFIYTLF